MSGISEHFQGDIIERFTSTWLKSVIECQHVIYQATHAFWELRNLKTLNLPLTSSSVSSPMGIGSDSQPVSIDMFGVKTYLADSMQFGLELGCRAIPQGCYYIMPSFRGEAPDPTHLCQFFHSEAELPGSLDNILDCVEAYIVFLSKAILVKCPDAILISTGNLRHLEQMADKQSFMRITFTDAAKLLKNDPNCIQQLSKDTRRITRYGEVMLMRKLGAAVWVTHFDRLSVPFYQACDPHDSSKALAADLLLGLGEVVGAGERHSTDSELAVALEMHQIDPKEYEWYIAMKRRKPLRTSGFGLGIERFLAWAFQVDDVRLLELLPRVNGLKLVP